MSAAYDYRSWQQEPPADVETRERRIEGPPPILRSQTSHATFPLEELLVSSLRSTITRRSEQVISLNSRAMKIAFPRLSSLLSCFLVVSAMLLALPSDATEDIAFRLSQEESKLSVTLLGSSSAYYPSVLRVRSDGVWERLPVFMGPIPRVELRPGETFEMEWPARVHSNQIHSLEQAQPVMVRYYEQIGIGVGQIGFFYPPPKAEGLLVAGYKRGLLAIRGGPNQSGEVAATWVLWPHEDGVETALGPFGLDGTQPPARRIDWRSTTGEVRIDTGRGQPEAILLHETAGGYLMQTVPGGQRAPYPYALWIEAATALYRASLVALAIAVLTLLLQRMRPWRTPAS